MRGSLRARLAILGLLVSAGPAVAQFGTILGEPPPRPPSSVPSGQSRQRPPPPPAGEYVPPEGQYVPPGGQYVPPSGQYGSPADGPLPPPPGRPAAPATVSVPPVQSEPLPAPPGGVMDPGRAAAKPGGAPVVPGPAGPAAPPAAPPPPDEVVTELPPQKTPNPTAVFSGLDKITGRITAFDVAMGETVQFGALRVRPRVCYTRPPTEAPNTTGFIEVDEVTLQGEVKRLFRGWMFATSPGLHGVEHPIYDVWLADCKGAVTAAIEEPPAPPPPPPAAAQRPSPSGGQGGRPAAAPSASPPRQSSTAAPQGEPRQRQRAPAPSQY